MADLEYPPAKKTRRSHNFGGCVTCRRRHLKCDKAQPACLTCKLANISCEGYQTGLKWVSTDASVTNSSNGSSTEGRPVRSHLYSESSRMSMSNDLQARVSRETISESLSKLDTLSKDGVHDDRSLADGPFRVLHFAENASKAEPTLSSAIEAVTMAESSNDPMLLTGSPETLFSVDSAGSRNYANDFLDWADLFELDLEQPEFTTDDFLMHDVSYIAGTELPQDGTFPGIDHPAQSLPPFPNDTGSAIDNRNSPLRDIQVQEAQILLKYFRNHVIANMVSLPVGDKCMWDILHVRTAILSLTDIMFDNSSQVSDAAMTNLLAILAISAKRFSHREISTSTEQSTRWERISDTAISLAKDHLKLSLKDAASVNPSAKYKDQNMALSAMLAYAFLYDRQREARAYMIDTERIFRTRGFSKRTISRKTRMLHHLYTWTRIVGESTYVLRDYEKCELTAAIKSDIVSSKKRRKGATQDEADNIGIGQGTRLDDFLRLDVVTSSSQNKQKVHEDGLRDIHLEDPREFSENMYLQLYGVQEKWLKLVSQTTRLANVIDTVEAKKEKDTDLFKSLERRKQKLEDMICAFSAKNSRPQPEADSRVVVESPRACMVRALDAALVIFFYRRVRNVNPWILQTHVDTVIQELKDFEASCKAHNIEGPGSPWPGFMAGSEAMSKDQRMFFTTWFEKGFEQTGFSRFKSLLSCVQEVWKRKDGNESGRSGQSAKSTWIHVCREQQLYPLVA